MNLDPDIVRRARTGDEAARAAFLRACAGPVRALVRRLFGPPESEDRLQEVLLHLLKVLPRFDPGGPASAGTWVHTVAYRFLLMQLRRPKLALVPLHDAQAVADARPSQERTLERRQLHRLLEIAVEALPPEQRRTFVMARFHQVPLAEIAQAEGVPLGTVKSRLHRAKAELVSKLDDALDDEPRKGGDHVANG